MLRHFSKDEVRDATDLVDGIMAGGELRLEEVQIHAALHDLALTPQHRAGVVGLVALATRDARRDQFDTTIQQFAGEALYRLGLPAREAKEIVDAALARRAEREREARAATNESGRCGKDGGFGVGHDFRQDRVVNTASPDQAKCGEASPKQNAR